MDEEDVVEKRRFKDILKWYNKKENNIHNVWDDGKKSKKIGRKIDRIIEKKKKNIMEIKDSDILFECEILKKIDRKIELWNILLQYWK